MILDSTTQSYNFTFWIALGFSDPYEYIADGIFHNVTAQGAKNTVLLDCASLSAPTAVRYAWKDNPLKANVRSLSGLPMSSFELKVKK